jgi:septum formation protein
MPCARPGSSDPLRPPIVLASASPRRAALLAGIGVTFAVDPSAVEEALRPGESPAAAARRLAAAKAAAVQPRHPDSLVLGADTLVVADTSAGSQAFGKPEDADDAARMLRALSGRSHRVVTGIALAAPGGRLVTDLAETRVWFEDLSAQLVEWYLRTGEAADKAGAYGVQGAAALFVRRIDGSWTNVVGLPVERLPDLFAAAGYALLPGLPTRGEG